MRRRVSTHGNVVFSSINTIGTGGAIDNSIATSILTVSNSDFSGNTAGAGGAIYGDGMMTVTNSTFNSNTAGDGGAIASGGSLTVTNCTFTNNTVTSNSATGLGGGAIYSSSNLPAEVVTITGSTFTGNAEVGGSGGGGAVRNRSGSMTITNSTFTSNTGLAGGGAIHNTDILSISDSTFTGNSASGPNAQQSGQGSGGAISNQGGGQLTIANSVITGNAAVNHGGGVYYQPNGGTPFMTITNTTISNNTANSNNDTTGGGGGVYIVGPGVATVTGSTISRNTAIKGAPLPNSSGDGGGFDVGGALTLINSTVSGNFAGGNYGGIEDSNPGGSADRVDISNSTIVDNRAAGNVGGFGVDSVSDAADQSVRNTIIANNVASGGTAQDVFRTTSAPINSLGYNLFKNTTGATIGGTTATNITGQDPNLGSLQNNGGLTFTHALLTGSPAIDKGSSGTLTTDQRQQIRPFDNQFIANASGGDGADIGAFEVQPAFVTVDGRVLTADGRGLRNATVSITDANNVTRFATTSSFGFFAFSDIATGQSYTVRISSRLYRYSLQTAQVNGNMTLPDFVGLE